MTFASNDADADATDAADAMSGDLEVGAACDAAERCTSRVCTGGFCIAPSPDDHVQNGDETDVDCGGSSPNPRCLAGSKCLAQSDCASDACPAGSCSEHPSCKRMSGGATCGVGEVGDPTAKHEDCCTTLDVPRADGSSFKMDKYLVTAGRLRGFLEDPAVSYDVKMSRPEWFEARTVYAQAESKTCTQATDCDYPSPTPGTASLCVDGTCPRKYPWGNGPIGDTHAERQARAAYDGNYVWPLADAAHANAYPVGTDQANYLPAPGRFPLGAGPYGHQDLLGAVEQAGSVFDAANVHRVTDGWFQFSWQECAGANPCTGKHPFGDHYASFGVGSPYPTHYAIGARCVMD